METVAVRSDVSSVVSQTEVLNQDEADTSGAPVLRLRLKKPKTDRKVAWTEGTVDNEHMGKKKSKCCCIYHKPAVFGESSSEDDGECEHCFGHPEKRKKKKKHHEHDHNPDNDGKPNEDNNPDKGDGAKDEDGPTCSWSPKPEV